MKKIILEILHANPSRRRTCVFDAESITVGRGYDNDVVLPDLFVSPRHIRITAKEEGWLVEDFGSENGLFVKKENRVVSQARLRPGDVFIIGKTRMRIVSEDSPVEPTESLVPKDWFMKFLSHPLAIVGIIVAMLLMYIIEVHLNSSDNKSIPTLMSAGIGVLMLSVMWAGLWAFCGKLVKHKSRFFVHLTISALYFLVFVPMGNMSEYVGYYMNNRFLEAALMGIFFIVVFVFLMVRVLRISTHVSIKQGVISSTIIAILFIAISILFYYGSKAEFDSSPDYYSNLKPPFVKVLANKDVSQIFDEAKEVFKIEIKK